MFYDQKTGAVILAVGFCTTCSVPLVETRFVSIKMDDKELLFCSQRCVERFERLPFNTHGAHW